MNYSSQIIDLFDNTDHAGVLQCHGDDVYVEQTGVAGRELFEISAQIKSDKIMAARFRTYGPPALIAAGEWTCRQLEYQHVQALSSITEHTLIEALRLSDLAVHIVALVCSAVKKIEQRVN